jgi:hypothetical protein
MPSGSVIYVARQLGHGAQLTLGTYGHVVDELTTLPGLTPRMRLRSRAGAQLPLSCP